MSQNPTKPVVAMLQGQMLILLCDGRQSVLHVGDMIYAAELAEAINAVTSEHMSGGSDQEMSR